MKLIAIFLFLSIAAYGACPSSVAYPYDGDSMHNSWNCKGFGASRICEFEYSKFVTENGQFHHVKHNTWVTCPQ
jgi:hypothetical protein